MAAFQISVSMRGLHLSSTPGTCRSVPRAGHCQQHIQSLRSCLQPTKTIREALHASCLRSRRGHVTVAANRDTHVSSAVKTEILESSVTPLSSPGPPPASMPKEPAPEVQVASLSDIVSNSQVPMSLRKKGLITEADRSKELSRLYRRTVFGFDEWREHRSGARYLRHMAGFWWSGIVRGLAGPLWVIAGIGMAITGYESLFEQGKLPEGFVSISIQNPAAFSFSSFALSLLLVFRTNSSYGRWDEARKMWGSLVNRMRDLVRQAESWFPDEEPELLDSMVRWCSSFPHVLQSHLRETNDLRTVLKDVLKPDELEALMATTHRPNFVLSVISRTIDEARLPTMARLRCDQNLTNFADVTGGCERILKTPIPLSYTRHTSRFLIIFLAFLPFTLWHACGYATVPASCAIAFLLLGIEEIGVQIEEPFGILPLGELILFRGAFESPLAESLSFDSLRKA